MKKLFAILICAIMCVTLLTSCDSEEHEHINDKDAITVIELNENNYWKYINVIQSGNTDDEKPIIYYEINGVLDYALYEDVVFVFDVIYYTDGQSDDQYQSYTMRIACNAAGDAAFETTYQGVTNVKIGKWLGTDGELVSLVNYNWKIHLNSVSGKVLYR